MLACTGSLKAPQAGLGLSVLLDMDGTAWPQADPGDYMATISVTDLDLSREQYYLPLELEPLQ